MLANLDRLNARISQRLRPSEERVQKGTMIFGAVGGGLLCAWLGQKTRVRLIPNADLGWRYLSAIIPIMGAWFGAEGGIVGGRCFGLALVKNPVWTALATMTACFVWSTRRMCVERSWRVNLKLEPESVN